MKAADCEVEVYHSGQQGLFWCFKLGTVLVRQQVHPVLIDSRVLRTSEMIPRFNAQNCVIRQ